jgi:hypothetical protein
MIDWIRKRLGRPTRAELEAATWDEMIPGSRTMGEIYKSLLEKGLAVRALRLRRYWGHYWGP